MDSNIFPFLVADIGGTNARFGIVPGTRDDCDRLNVERQKKYATEDYESFEEVFSTYLKTLDSDGISPKHACIAIAGPVVGDTMRMTNLDWTVSAQSLCKTFGFVDVKLINDFGALAYVSVLLKDDERIAGLIRVNGGWHPVCGEGGHKSFAPLDDHQMAIRKHLVSLSINEDHLSIENLVSGQGLVNLYQANCLIDGVDIKDKSPSDVSREAAEKTDDQCVRALQDFTKILGASMGDTALSLGAYGGLYLCGGILPQIIDAMDIEAFVDAFLKKGIQRRLMEGIPVYLVSAPMPALVGAANWLYDNR